MHIWFLNSSSFQPVPKNQRWILVTKEQYIQTNYRTTYALNNQYTKVWKKAIAKWYIPDILFNGGHIYARDHTGEKNISQTGNGGGTWCSLAATKHWAMWMILVSYKTCVWLQYQLIPSQKVQPFPMLPTIYNILYK